MTEREALEQAIVAVYPWARRVAALLCGDRDRAEDLAHDALAQAVRRPPEPLTDAVLRAWLRTVMVRMWLRRRHRALLEARALIRSWQPARDPETWSEETEVVLRALGGLSARQRACIVLRYLDDLSEQQVADALGVRLGTVKAHLAHGRDRLRVALSPEQRGGDLTLEAAPWHQEV